MNNPKRRTFLSKIFASIAALSFIPLLKLQAKASPAGPLKKKASFAHIVFFWLKNPDDADVLRQFEQELKTLTENIDVIVSTHIGTPAATSRGVIDNSYTYNLLLTFNNKKDQDIYQEHPVHLQFIKNAESMWNKVIVYDSVGV